MPLLYDEVGQVSRDNRGARVYQSSLSNRYHIFIHME